MASNDRRSDPRDFGRWCTVPPAGPPARGIAPDFPVGSVPRPQPRLDLRTARLPGPRQRQRLAHGLEGPVWKSAAWGKRLSVRLDLGGGGIIKKTKIHTT